MPPGASFFRGQKGPGDIKIDAFKHFEFVPLREMWKLGGMLPCLMIIHIFHHHSLKFVYDLGFVRTHLPKYPGNNGGRRPPKISLNIDVHK